MAGLNNQINNLYEQACSTFSSTDPICASYTSSRQKEGYRRSSSGYYYKPVSSANSITTGSRLLYKPREEPQDTTLEEQRKRTFISVPDVEGLPGETIDIKIYFKDSDGNPLDPSQGDFYIAVNDEGVWKGVTSIVTQNGFAQIGFEIPKRWSGSKKIRVTFKGELPWKFKKPEPEYAEATLRVKEPPLKFDYQFKGANKSTLFVENPTQREFKGKMIISYNNFDIKTQEFSIPSSRFYKKLGKWVDGKTAMHIELPQLKHGDSIEIKIIDRSTGEEIHSEIISKQ